MSSLNQGITMAQYVIKQVQAAMNKELACFYSYSSAGLVVLTEAERFKSLKSAQKFIDDFVSSGNWKRNAFRALSVDTAAICISDWK